MPYDKMHAQSGRVYSPEGIAPTVHCMGGGNLEPKVIQISNVNPSGHGMNGNVYSDQGIAPTLTTNKGEGNKIAQTVELPCIAASRGRNPENPSDRTTGSPTEQRLELNTRGVSNTLTSVSKDNYVVEPKVLCPQRQYDEEGNRSVAHTVSDIVPTIRATQYKSGDNQCKIIEQTFPCIRIRKLIPLECFRLMDFSDEDFNRARDGINNTFNKGKDRASSQLYKIAGNSIVVNVLVCIYLEVYKAMPYLFEDIKLGSFFSGAGAFEVALDRLFEAVENNTVEYIVAPNFIQPKVV